MHAAPPTPLPPAASVVHPALRRLTALALSGRDAGALLEALVAEAGAGLGADASVLLIARTEAVERTIAAEPHRDHLQVLDDRPSGVAHVVTTGRALAVEDARTSRDVRTPHAHPRGVAGALFVPLAWHGEVRHVLLLTTPEPRAWTGADVELAEALAGQAALGLALREAEDHRTAQSALARAARALNRSLDPAEILGTLAREADVAVGATAAEVYLLDEATGQGVAAGHEPRRVAPAGGAAARVLATGEPVVLGAVHHDAEHAHSELAVPMRWDGRLRGALCVRFAGVRHVGGEQLAALEAMAELAVVACRNAEAYQHARTAASTDPLTGLLNHGALQLRIREEIARAARDDDALTCILIDLDDFKRVNDEHGHLAGDALLREVAGALRAELRPYDCAARYGGDEFVLLLPGTDEPAARAVADRVRDNLRAAGDRAGREPARCSVGIAGWSPGMDADDLLAQADRGLLLAKRTGKGRTAIATIDTDAELERLTAPDGEPVAVQALAAAIEARDHYFQGHSDEVVRLATQVAMIMGLPADAVDRIGHAALLHDVGKLAVPPAILGKDGALDEEEWAVMATHPILGEQILLRLPQLAGLAPIVRHEHEHWDGSGYPDGLAGTRIPLGARIILACDAYSAMTTPRPYRPAKSKAEACDELRACAGTQFDPDVVEALLDVLGA